MANSCRLWSNNLEDDRPLSEVGVIFPNTANEDAACLTKSPGKLPSDDEDLNLDRLILGETDLEVGATLALT